MNLTLKEMAEGIRRTGAAISGTLAGDYVYWPADAPAMSELRDLLETLTAVAVRAHEDGDAESAPWAPHYINRLVALGLLEEVVTPEVREERRRLIDEADAKRAAEGRKPIPEFKHVALTWDSYGWLLETLRDLAPADVAEAMITDGMVDRGGMICGEPTSGATWADESERTDPHENMGTAVAGIVAELVANEDGLESLAARVFEHVGSNGQEFEADDLLAEFNELIERRYPRGHRGLF